MSKVKTILKACVCSYKLAICLMLMVCLLVACTSGTEHDGVSAPMKFTVPGGDALLRAVDAGSIEARYTLLLDNQQSAAAVMMTRIDQSDQWETTELTIPPNVGFLFQLSWSAADVTGARVAYAMQNFRSETGINSNQSIDITDQSYNFDVFDDDDDGFNNFDELVAGTPANESFDTDTTVDPGTPAEPVVGDGEATLLITSIQPPNLNMADSGRLSPSLTLSRSLVGGNSESIQLDLVRLGDTEQWQADPAVVILGAEYMLFLTWFLSSDDGSGPMLLPIADAGVIFTVEVNPVNVSFMEQSYVYDFYDNDSDGVSNYEELLAGTDAIDSGADVEEFPPGAIGLEVALQANGAGAIFGPLQDAGFVNNISRDSAWTSFLPNDAAVAAAVAAGATFDSAALAAHIYSDGAISDLNAVVGTTLTMNSNGGSPVVAIEADGDTITVGGHTVVSEAINVGGPGFVYIIDGVIPQGN